MIFLIFNKINKYNKENKNLKNNNPILRLKLINKECKFIFFNLIKIREKNLNFLLKIISNLKLKIFISK